APVVHDHKIVPSPLRCLKDPVGRGCSKSRRKDCPENDTRRTLSGTSCRNITGLPDSDSDPDFIVQVPTRGRECQAT
ncbi:hypothetical protein BaRGS_00021898, partial [Batillaria attramentaria]